MKLYPRLGHQAATALFNELMELDLRGRRERVATHHVAETWAATGASRVGETELLALRDALVAVAAAHGFPDDVLGRADVVAFDREATRQLHEKTDLTLAEAAFPAMWSFIALVLLPDLTWWRARGSTNVERFVCSDQTRHSWARLWQRAHLLTWGFEDPSAAWTLLTESEIGEATLDQIQTRRVAYGQQPAAFRALLRLYRESDDKTKFDERRSHGFLARLLRVGAFLDFRALTEVELYEAFGAFLAEGESGEHALTFEDEPTEHNEATSFDDLQLDQVMVHVVEAVRASGSATETELAELFERVSGIAVPPPRRDLVRGIAWQASSRAYLQPDEAGRWIPGDVLPAPDTRWSGRTDNSIKEYIASLNGDTDPDAIAAAVFAGKAGRTIRRFVRTLITETTR
jgi:hypothetical protein